MLGPVVAQDAATARSLIAVGVARCVGTFLRLDLTDTSLAEDLERAGLLHAGGGTVMVKSAHIAPDPAATPFKTYALVSQALG